MKKRVLLSSVLCIVLCLTLIAGSTFALFSDKATVNIAITTGNLDVNATAENLQTYSRQDGVVRGYTGNGAFLNGGSAYIKGGIVTLEKVTPGDEIDVDINVDNNSDVAIKYRVIVDVIADNGLYSGLVVTAAGFEDIANFNGFATTWLDLAANDEITDGKISVALPYAAGNEYQNKSATLAITVEAVQANADEADAYDRLLTDDAGNYLINTVFDLKMFAAMVNSGETDFDNETVLLNANLNLEGIVYIPPVGFGGTFDGQGHTVSNMTINNIKHAGLIGNLHIGTVKNVNVDNANVNSTFCAGAVVGNAIASTISGCNVTNSTITAAPALKGDKFDDGNNAGGIVGYISGENASLLDGNSVSNTTVKAYRDLGAVAGTVNRGTTVTNNTATNVNVIPLSATPYVSVKATNAGEIAGRNLTGNAIDASNVATNVVIGETVTVSTTYDFINALKAAKAGTPVVITLTAGKYDVAEKLAVASGKDVTLVGAYGDEVVIDAYIKVSGKLTIKNLDIQLTTAKGAGEISQFSKSAIALTSSGDLYAENVNFDINLADGTAVTAWWSIGDGANATFENCVFNCYGNRPVRSDACVTMENCVINDPYRYAIQMTSKSSTMAPDAEAYVIFNNNVINAGSTSSKPVYGIQLEGGYGCADLTVNGEGNVINLNNTGKESAMYYCECGNVDHTTIVWNVEVDPVHEN